MKTLLKKTITGFPKPTAVLSMVLLSTLCFPAIAQQKDAKPVSSSVFSQPAFIALLITVILLLIVIIVLANVTKAAGFYKMEQMKKEKEDQSSSGIGKLLVVVLITSFSTGISMAQEALTPAVTAATEVTTPAAHYWGMSATVFYAMMTMIVFELFVIGFLYRIAMQLLGARERREKQAAAQVKKVVKKISLLEKLNDSVAIEKEEDIMLDHNYDGIRELDNNLPPWWKYGFYLTIVFSVIYLFHYHVSHTGKLQVAEYEAELKKAEHELAEYHKKAANLVDESNATLLTDAAALESGKAIFSVHCAACHGHSGEGGVGPNLTDVYWLHGGEIKDVFKSVKFGWPEMGMKSWQQDLGAKQIHEVSSYIKSLEGTNPPNGKEPQGELFQNKSDTAVVTK